jgi:DNA-binding CsgD family transcriptional regulator
VDSAALQRACASIIEDYLNGDADQALRDAHEAGRRTVDLEDGLQRLVAAYHAALGRCVARESTVRDAARLVGRATAVIVQSLAPHETALRHPSDNGQVLPSADNHPTDLLVAAATSEERLRLASAIHADALRSLAAVGTRLDLLARQLGDLDTEASIARSSTSLTDREHEILGMIAGGATNPDVARRLVVSEHTVKSHVQNILRKLGVKNRAQAAACYFAPHPSEH